jgi:hypothetical protein
VFTLQLLFTQMDAKSNKSKQGRGSHRKHQRIFGAGGHK